MSKEYQGGSRVPSGNQQRAEVCVGRDEHPSLDQSRLKNNLVGCLVETSRPHVDRIVAGGLQAFGDVGRQGVIDQEFHQS